MAGKNKNETVALFVTCLVDLWRPGVAEAASSLLKKAGYKVDVPRAQTCCGQVNYNGGDQKGAEKLARHHTSLFSPYDYVVVPSGSCADMVKNQYPVLLAEDPEMLEAALALAAKTYELTKFLTRVAKWRPKTTKGPPTKLAYHDSCSCKRALRIYQEPRMLLEATGRYDIAPLEGEDRCCGFGGLFSLKFGEVSSHLAGQKCSEITKTGAEVVAGADLGCLLNLAGRMKADGVDCQVRHIAEVLDQEERK